MNGRTAAVTALLAAGSGTSCAAKLVKAFSSFESYCEAEEKDFDPSVFTPQDISRLLARDVKRAERTVRLCDDRGCGITSYYDPGYPALLRNIPDPPLVLFTRGNPLPDLSAGPTISVVGTRNAKKQYIKFAAVNGFSLAVLGFTVVSGYAEGIDSFSLKGALYAGGKVISVLPCGVDILPGKSDEKLLSAVYKHGTIVSEYIPGTPLRLWQFSKRNRIISGMTQSTLVVEAGIESGALSTAQYAFDQGRVVYAVPDEPYEPRSEGSNCLLRNGGTVASSFLDIVEDYNNKYGYGIDVEAKRAKLYKGFGGSPAIVVSNEAVEAYMKNTAVPRPKSKKSTEEASPASSAEKEASPASSMEKEASPASSMEIRPPQTSVISKRASPAKEEKPEYPLLAAEDITVLNLLKKQPSTLDGVCSALDMTFPQAVSELARLTDLGYTEETPGGFYILKK